MGVNVTDRVHAALYDSVSGTAFGPVFDGTDDALAFLAWLENTTHGDPRDIREDKLADIYKEWKGTL